MKRSKKKKKYEVVKLDLPLDVVKKIQRVAKIANLTPSKVVVVLLAMGIEREEK